MRNLEEFFSPEVIASANRAADRETERCRGKAVRMTATGIVTAEVRTEHCFDPWFIARCQSRSHRRASEALAREGFEVWYPAGRVLTMMPQRFIGPRKRKRKQVVLREDVRTPYGDYMFLRRLFGSYDLMRLYDLSGMMGLCITGERPSMVHDYQIESLRLAEFDGEFDQIKFTRQLSATALSLADIQQTEAAKERWNTKRSLLNILDESRRTIQFVEEFGRITRVETGQGDRHSPDLIAMRP